MSGISTSQKISYWGKQKFNYLIFYSLKIKQRQKEYWKKRIKRDFSPSLDLKKRKRRYDLQNFGKNLESIDENDSSRLILKLNKM